MGLSACLRMPTTHEAVFFRTFSSCWASLLLIVVRVLLPVPRLLSRLPLTAPRSPLLMADDDDKDDEVTPPAEVMPTLPRLPAMNSVLYMLLVVRPQQ